MNRVLLEHSCPDDYIKDFKRSLRDIINMTFKIFC